MQFCTHCRLLLNAQPAPDIVNGRTWRPRAEEFAVRIRAENYSQLFPNGLEIDITQRGLQFEQGRLLQVLEPGQTAHTGLLQKLAHWLTGTTRSFVLLQQADCRILLEGRLKSKDGDDISFSCSLAFRITDHTAFYQHFMQHCDVVIERHLLRDLAPGVRRQFAAAAARCTSLELQQPDPELLQRMADDAEQALQSEAQRMGLQISWISQLHLTSEQYADFDRERSRLLHDLRDRRLAQSYAEQLDQLEMRRYKAAKILGEETIRHLIDKAEQDAEYEALKRELRQRAELSDLNLREQLEQSVDAYRERRRTVAVNQQNASRERTFLLAQQDIACSRQLATLRFELREESIRQDQTLDDLKRNQRLKVAEAELIAELKRAELSQAAQLTVRLNEARTASQIEELVAESAIRITGARDAQRIERLKTLSQTHHDHLGRLLDLKARRQQQKQQQAEFEQKQREQEKDNQHARHLQELESLKQAPAILQLMKLAELAVGSPLLAGAFAEAMRLQMASGLTVDQLQVLAAEKSPAVADMLTRRYEMEQLRSQQKNEEAQRSHRIEGLEQVIAELQRNQDLSEQRMKDIMDRLERVGIHGQQMLRDVLTAITTAHQPPRPENHNSTARETDSEKVIRLLLEELRELRKQQR